MQTNDNLILIIDEEKNSRDFISSNLKQEGYNVLEACGGQEGIILAKKKMPNLILLDLVLSDMDGIETCERLRQEPSLSNTIISFFTSCSDEQVIVLAYEAGADDYITKPIKPRVLLTKLNSLLRRRFDKKSEPTSRKVGDLLVDSEKYKVFQSGRPIIFPRKEFELLSLLVSKPNKVFTRSEIFNHIWHDEGFLDDKTISVHVRKIRAKLGTDNIKTIKKVGYKYEYEL